MVNYCLQDIKFLYNRKRSTRRWLNEVAAAESKSLGDINIIFCSDAYILEINKKYLGHDYYTDIITFDYCIGSILSGDLFISIDTVRDNASFYNSTFDEELHRVIVHGILHLIGYDDKTDNERLVMRSMENRYLELRRSMNL